MSRTLSIDIPLRRQFSESTCVPACMTMVLIYFGQRISVRAAAEELGTTKKHGTAFERAGLSFLRRGFQVSCYGWTKDYPNRFLTLPEDAMASELRHWLHGSGAKSLYTRTDRFDKLAYLEAGGRMRTRPIRFHELRRAMSRGEPSIIGLNSGLIMPVREKVVHHAVVPVNLTARSCIIHDPYPASYGGRQELPLWRFLFANQSDDGEALVISSPTVLGGTHG